MQLPSIIAAVAVAAWPENSAEALQ
jgi:hypothetical protein